MVSLRFEPVDLPPGLPAFREEIRTFLATELGDLPAAQRANSWSVADPAFSRKLGARGWIGMVWPRRYGGAERSAIERYVLLEELLAYGAPVGAHWIADRQSGPSLLRYGTPEQCARYLPAIARGELYSCIGMSEPNAGSDLAAVSTRGERLADGRWRINGQKILTTNAGISQLMIALVRTAPRDPENRHSGLSQFLVDLQATEGVTIRPIEDLVGGAEFNEVFFDDCVLPADALLGEEGAGWTQCTSELSLERSGPERYLSSFALYRELLRYLEKRDDPALRQLAGGIAAELWTLRQMSLSVAGQLADGRDPALEAACVKDLGNSLEQAIPRRIHSALPGDSLSGDSDLARTLGLLLQVAPSFSLRGGTREILRGIIARGLGLR
jgi:alkylation response protein AidB-like acyl-CoA dehydrogenase